MYNRSMGLDSIELVMEVEDEFRLHLPDEECEKVRTVDDVVDLVMKYRPDADRRVVLQEVRKLTAEIVSAPLDQVHSNSRLVEDLGYD